MSLVKRYIGLILLVMLSLCSHALASTTGAITITGAEQSTAGIWDIGTVTVSVNNYSKTVFYGQFSTTDSLASAIAALFSSDCNGPANAKSYPGGVIVVQMKGSNALTQLNISFTSTLSFHGSVNLSTVETTTTATIGSTELLLGQTTPVDVQVSCNSACGQVDYRIDGGEWGTVALSASGHFQAATGNTWSPGLHNVVVKFLGNGTYMPSISDPVSFTISSSATSVPPTSIYSYAITSYQANGNVAGYTDSVNGTWSNIAYDGVNRLTAATQVPNSGTTQYLCWTYDSFGNRKSQTVSGTQCNVSTPPTPTSQWQYNNANNQVTGTIPASLAVAYDSSGNVKTDANYQFLYDAEGRVCASYGPMGVTQYIYDAEGQRVAKGTNASFVCDTTNFAETSGYVLGPHGEEVTEVDGNGDWVHTNVYAAGGLIATYKNDQQIHFYLGDWLGTRRVQTNYAGVIEQTCTSNPFGDAPPCSGANEHFFTGKERDAESGLDYFGARYNSSSMGRFMSPDPLGGHLENPQSLNKYAYALNNPLTNTDPTGLDSYLQCQTASSTCASQTVGYDSKGNAQTALVQGVTNSDKSFTATQIGNDANGNLVDKTTGTGSYTASVNGSGVNFSNNGGQSSSTGVFVNGTPQTTFQDAGFANGGALSGFNFTLTNSKMEANQAEAGTFSFSGTPEQAGAALQRAGFQ
jgi:RHS repeat-associated protein